MTLVAAIFVISISKALKDFPVLFKDLCATSEFLLIGVVVDGVISHLDRMKYGGMFLCRHPGDLEPSGRGLMKPVRTSVRNILIYGSGLESDRVCSRSTASGQSNLGSGEQ